MCGTSSSVEKRALVEHARLKELLHYDPATGHFTWRVSKGRRVVAGKLAGNKVKVGPDREYWQVRIDGRNYYGHRLAWFYLHGKWPEDRVSHRDKCGLNNAEINLVEARNPFLHTNASV